ncbi:hypothetical protein [Actinoplanes sp. HUAS TT8]|uniref:hypothetical protein n=1 Tax=Actinoplanes sp. HUAS TT8 TaxID=3447453 RepID=UPI003F51C61B
MFARDLLNCARRCAFTGRSTGRAVTVIGGATSPASSGDKSGHTSRWTPMVIPTASLDEVYITPSNDDAREQVAN